MGLSGEWSEHVRRSLEAMDEEKVNIDAMEALIYHLDETRPAGAVLVFMPGQREIEALLGGPEACRQVGGSCFDILGVPRGQCPACNACPGFAMPPTGQDLMLYCLHCGCSAAVHEQLRSKHPQNDDV
uniref:Uncharacterized protein n=1 Tax=Calcidiscus leptoporus TaxID=127549 RepID=A0A7S0P137_9EUKA